MSALRNARQERFAQAVAGGKTQIDAYVDAGYKRDDGAASRLSGNVKIAERVKELLTRAAVRTEVTVTGITERLLAIAAKGEKASDAPMLGVARAALMDAAKLNGLVVDKAEFDSVQRILSDKPQTDEEWAESHGIDMGAAARPAALSH